MVGPHITYSEILDALISDFKQTGKSEQEIKNHRSVFRQWLILFNKTERDIATEFDSIDDNLKRFINEKGYSENSIPSRRYWLKNFYNKYVKLKFHSNPPSSFHDRLSYYIKLSGMSQTAFAKKIGVTQQTINAWCLGSRRPHKSQRDKIKKIEKVLGCAKNTLIETIKYWYGDGSHNEIKPGKTTFSELQSLRYKSKYGLNYLNWPRKVKEQWKGLKKHHTEQKSPLLPRHKWAVWDKPSTILSRRRFFEFFFGFLTLPKKKGGLGFKKCDLDIRLMAYASEDGSLTYFDPFIDFLKSRTICSQWPEGVYTKSVKRDLKALAVFIHSKNGYFVNAPELNLLTVNGLSWKENCSKAMDRVVSLLEGTTFVQIRDPEEPVDFIIDDQYPMRYLRLLVKNLEVALPPKIKKSYDRRVANWYFTCAFLSAVPLRASMVANMKLDKNLYRDAKGLWRVKFEAQDFKNTKGAAKDRKYDIICPYWLQPIIDQYLGWRKLFPGGGVTEDGQYECEYVIRPAVNNGVRRANDLPVDKHTIYKWCIMATSLYILGCSGFGPHAWRHIIATDWIKNNPAGFQIAAQILHDRYETVKASYEHLDTSDWTAHFNQYEDRQFLDESSYSKHYDKASGRKVGFGESDFAAELNKERERNDQLQEKIDKQNIQLEKLQDSVHNLTQLLASTANSPAA